jgi:YHS domain-containing protein
MTLSRRTILSLFAAGATTAILSARPALAREPDVFQTSGVAINGIDPIAYFADMRPVIGSARHALMWNGATWHFASVDNMETFKANPEKFTPVFGGYCAFAASRGYLAPTIPEAWTIHKDRLYLNASLRARTLWLEDIPGNIAKGFRNWPGILG